MKKFYLIHGFEAMPNGGWRPWLMRQLYKVKVFALALEMPNPWAPIMTDWVSKIKQEVGKINEDKYLVGHSLGVPAILRYLESVPEDKKFGGAFLVSGPFEKLDIENKSSRIRPIDNFFETSFNFEHIKKVCSNFYTIHRDNDPAVPFSHAEIFSKELNAPITKILNGGHLGDHDGFPELPQLLDLILENIK